MCQITLRHGSTFQNKHAKLLNACKDSRVYVQSSEDVILNEAVPFFLCHVEEFSRLIRVYLPKEKATLVHIFRTMIRQGSHTSWKDCNLIIRIPGVEYTGISSKVLENLEYEPIFGAVFLPRLYL